MRLDELEDSLPNGFHDASIEGIVVDYVSQRATLQMKLLVSSPEAETQSEREIYKRGKLQLLRHLVFCNRGARSELQICGGEGANHRRGKNK